MTLVASVALATSMVAEVQRDAKGAWMGVLDEHPAIEYATRAARDPIAMLNARLAAGTASLTFGRADGYLSALLSVLDLTAESQMLVLSRTGVQSAYTRPWNPRALYFNEQVSVGYIRGSPFLELMAQDPEQGAIFYTLDQRATQRPTFTRQTSCVRCHVATATLEVPGFMTRSLVTATDGTLRLRLGSFDVDHRTPFEQRWGGFYVTGAHGRSRHMGNVVAGERDERQSLVPAGPLNVRTLEGALDLSDYAASGSDVVALAVFDHQNRALNLMTRLGWEARVAAHEGRGLATPAIEALVGDLVDYLLFVNEAPMPGGLAGSSGFTAWFSARGPRDARGRSLHALDLTSRLMRYPCSYTVYSPAFDALPDEIRARVFRGLGRALTGSGPSDARYAHLSASDRRAILEILRETKPEATRLLPGP